jgi:hypothetical protein
MTAGFRCSVNVIFALLRYYVADWWLVMDVQALWDNLSVPSTRVKQPKTNYQSTIHNIPQEEIPVLNYFQISLMDHLQFLFARMPTPMEEDSE